MQRKGRSLIVNGLLFLVSTGVTLCLLEVFCGYLLRFDRLGDLRGVEDIPQGERIDFCQYDPLLGYDGIPNIRKTFQGTTVSQNSFGNRGVETTQKKPSGTERVLLAGDSQVWGYRVNDEETIASQLQLALNKEQKSTNYEVINLGVSGYGPDQAFLKTITKGLAFEPDHVVFVYFHLNDLFDISNHFAWGVEKPQFLQSDNQLCLTNVPPPRAAGWPNNRIVSDSVIHLSVMGHTLLSYDSRILALLKKCELSASFRNLGDSAVGRILPYLFLSDEAKIAHQYLCDTKTLQRASSFTTAVDAVLAVIDEFKSKLEERGIRFTVVMVPVKSDYQAQKQPREYLEIKAGLQKRNIVVVDAYEEGQRRNLDEHVFYIEGDEHLSRFGNWIVAQELDSLVTRD